MKRILSILLCMLVFLSGCTAESKEVIEYHQLEGRFEGTAVQDPELFRQTCDEILSSVFDWGAYQDLYADRIAMLELVTYRYVEFTADGRMLSGVDGEATAASRQILIEALQDIALDAMKRSVEEEGITWQDFLAGVENSGSSIEDFLDRIAEEAQDRFALEEMPTGEAYCTAENGKLYLSQTAGQKEETIEYTLYGNKLTLYGFEGTQTLVLQKVS